MTPKTMATAAHFEGCEGGDVREYIDERCDCGVRIGRDATEELHRLRERDKRLADIERRLGSITAMWRAYDAQNLNRQAENAAWRLAIECDELFPMSDAEKA